MSKAVIHSFNCDRWEQHCGACGFRLTEPNRARWQNYCPKCGTEVIRTNPPSSINDDNGQEQLEALARRLQDE